MEDRKIDINVRKPVTGNMGLVGGGMMDENAMINLQEMINGMMPKKPKKRKVTIAEVEELVPVGELDPNTIHTPGIFVQRIFQGDKYEKRIEQRTTRPRA